MRVKLEKYKTTKALIKKNDTYKRKKNKDKTIN